MASPKPILAGLKEAETMSTNMSPAVAVSQRRLTINLSDKAYQDLNDAAQDTSRTMTDVIRIAIGLFRVAAEVIRDNNKLVVVSPSGKPLKEIVLPR